MIKILSDGGYEVVAGGCLLFYSFFDLIKRTTAGGKNKKADRTGISKVRVGKEKEEG